jgi:predicted amidohydrolase YtcJ
MITGTTVGGSLITGPGSRLSREQALRLYTSGSAWFTGEEHLKGTIAPGQYADLAVLSADYLGIPDERTPAIESVLTITGGDVVYAAPPFQALSPAPLPAASPAWSPVALFGGYQHSN